jgi:hypothetical protein
MSCRFAIARAVSRPAAVLIAGIAAATAAEPSFHVAHGPVRDDAPGVMARLGPGSTRKHLGVADRERASPGTRASPGFERTPQEDRERPLAVTCRVQNDPDARVYVLRQTATAAPDSARRWQLSMRDRETGDRWIRLTLPGAAPTLAGNSARLSYRNANGGRQVDLEVRPDASRLDVWVDYGLDVNIEPDLDPRVDRLNTHGPLTALACTIGAEEPDRPAKGRSNGGPTARLDVPCQ